MLPFDPVRLLHDSLRGDRRPPDGKLHPSGDLLGSLRHSQLRAAGAPTIESEIVSDVRLMTGTRWHSYFENMFRRAKLPVMTEVKLDRWLPKGWSGTADWLAWSDQYKAFVLGDLKTIKGEGMPWVEKDGIKEEHMWQLSAYWYAVAQMGIPLVKGFAVMYLPMNVPADAPDVEPVVMEGKPLDETLVLGTMAARWTATEEYLFSLPPNKQAYVEGGNAIFLNEKLAPVQERVQKVFWTKSTGVFDVKLVPHWSAAYCPFPTELCDCREQGTTKIGHYTLDGEYVPRKLSKGYEEHVAPTVKPADKDIAKRRKEKENEAEKQKQTRSD